MDVTRAQEIIQSKGKIVVEFEGTPVWIDGVDENSKTARVHMEENPVDKKTVAVNELREIQH
jgi:small acid-soluble spore protein H (minor)